MKYVMTVLFATSLSLGAFAVGQNNTGPDHNCCTSGLCGAGMRTCDGAKRSLFPEKRSAASNVQVRGKNKSKKATNAKGD